jgi:hypothetical protein
MKKFLFIFRTPYSKDHSSIGLPENGKASEPYKLWLKNLKEKSQESNFMYLKLWQEMQVIGKSGWWESKMIDSIWQKLEGLQITQILFLACENKEEAFQLAESCPLPNHNWTIEIREIN